MRALVCGASGQDGAYLCQFLLKKGYEVIGTSRDAQVGQFSNLHKLKIAKDVQAASMAVSDFRSVFSTIKRFNPDEVYNLTGQTSVNLSFDQPVESIDSISIGTLNLLEVIRLHNTKIRFYNAGSSECFGSAKKGVKFTEQSAYDPKSPYGVAKSAAAMLVKNYRESYGIFASTGILFNHESPLRPDRFVTKKIVNAALRISQGSKEKLELGNIDIYRDWGWAPEYVEAMWKMLQTKKPDDYVIATGRSESLRYFATQAFKYFGLDLKKYLKINQQFFRPSEIFYSCGDASKAHQSLKWKAKTDIDGVIKNLCSAAQSSA
jgi:GDPmannose 4,6-dehydratase